MSNAMLRKRTRPSHHELSKDHILPDFDSELSFTPDVSIPRNKNASIFSVPGPLVGFSSKVLSDSDAVRSPTSPLDWKGFSNPVNPQGSSRRSSGLQRSWNCEPVGLGLVDSLKDETVPSRKVLGFLKNCSILCGSEKISSLSQGINPSDLLNPASEIPKSLPENSAESLNSEITPPIFDLKFTDTISESSDIQLGPNLISNIQPCSSDFVQSSLPHSRLVYCYPKPNSDSFSQSDAEDTVKLGNFSGKPSSLPISVISSHGFFGSFVSKEIELSEDYTRITSHGPNPKTTHIFGDCILESHTIELSDHTAEEGVFGPPSPKLEYPSHDFLRFCFSCKKKLEEDMDIYIYRGEKAFCSIDCRAQEILVEQEETEELDSNSPLSPQLTCCDDIVSPAMATVL